MAIGIPIGILMGYFIMDSWMRVSYIQMYSGILILSIIGVFFFILIDILEGIFCPWKFIYGR
ncbi:hypothetical protein [Clostridium sp.]|uniref:hypothetical protein n=1 Tax=Clostridium sp. TaxID=1506 RepID=UPI003D6CCD57